MYELMKNGKWNSELLKKEKWLYYLAITTNNATNCERVESIDSITGKETLDYVMKTLEALENIKENLTEKEYFIIKRVLQWSEVAKGGTEKQREQWIRKGYPLDIHNLASTKIYLEESNDSVEITNLVYLLIKTHGIIGQNIQGEVSKIENIPLYKFYDYTSKMCKDDIYPSTLLKYLNYCIMSGVRWNLWMQVEDEVNKIIDEIKERKLVNKTAEERLHCLFPSKKEFSSKTIKLFDEKVFPFFELWYFTSAIKSFSEEQVYSLMKLILKSERIQRVTHLNFKPLADSLYYDYEGKKHINVYKQRIIEKYLKNPASVENVSLCVEVKNNTMIIGFTFSSACSKLIDFCVEAERSGLLTYEKSIKVLFDMFGFRRDKYDRLNNEEKYLATMNDAQTSTKKSIADYVVGEKVVDVGSGGGVMLDLLEEKFPEKMVMGTDISENVLKVLNDKKENEGHTWITKKHNFVDEALPEKVDTIIFSSILHEIYSYSDIGNGKFDIQSVKNALINAYDSLNRGGRIVIRDGVKTPFCNRLTVALKTDEALDFFKNFCNDFKGLQEINRDVEISERQHIGYTVKADVNFMREFLFTYTWGTESYSHEVQEQFGYFTLDQFQQFFKAIGAKIIEAKEFLEDGYFKHLSETVVLPKADYPASNCIVVIEKQ